MLCAALLLAACSAEEEVASDGRLAISFRCTFDGQPTDGSTPDTRADEGFIAREMTEMQNQGFSVYASLDGSSTLNFMNAQQVTYAEASYPNVRPHWEYSPLKYWPNPAGTLHFHAFAPYASPTTADTGQAGIYAVGTTTGEQPAPKVGYRVATTARPSDNLLLFAYASVTEPSLKLDFRHALSRVAIRMKLASAPAEGCRVLLEDIRLTNTTPIASAGTFTLGASPAWSDIATDTPRSFEISNDPDDASAYAYLPSSVAYAPGLPARWQPAAGLTTTLQHVVSLGDYAAYLYLIPQETLTLSCTVAYRTCTPAADTFGTTQEKTISVALGSDASSALQIGRTINLNLTLTP